MKTRVIELLETKGIPYTLKPHTRPVYTSEDAARERGVRLSQIVKTMLVKTPEGGCIVALIPGHRKLDFKKLGKLAGVKKLEFVTSDEVQQLTGFIPGAVAPIGMQHTYPTFSDEAIQDEEFVDISSGQPEAGVELRSADLLRIVQATVAPISK